MTLVGRGCRRIGGSERPSTLRVRCVRWDRWDRGGGVRAESGVRACVRVTILPKEVHEWRSRAIRALDGGISCDNYRGRSHHRVAAPNRRVRFSRRAPTARRGHRPSYFPSVPSAAYTGTLCRVVLCARHVVVGGRAVPRCFTCRRDARGTFLLKTVLKENIWTHDLRS